MNIIVFERIGERIFGVCMAILLVGCCILSLLPFVLPALTIFGYQSEAGLLGRFLNNNGLGLVLYIVFLPVTIGISALTIGGLIGRKGSLI